MTETTKPTPAEARPLTMGLGIGLGLAAARVVDRLLEPSLGELGAVAFGVLAAGIVGGLVAWVMYRLTKPREANV